MGPKLTSPKLQERVTSVTKSKHLQGFIFGSLSARLSAALLVGIALCACAASTNVTDQRANTDARAQARNVSPAALADQWYTHAVSGERCSMPTPTRVSGIPAPSQFSMYRSPMVLVLSDLQRDPPAQVCLHSEHNGCFAWNTVTRIHFRSVRVMYAKHAEDIAGLPSLIAIEEGGGPGPEPDDVVARSLDLSGSLVVFAYYTDVVRPPGLLNAIALCELQQGQSEATVLE